MDNRETIDLKEALDKGIAKVTRYSKVPPEPWESQYVHYYIDYSKSIRRPYQETNEFKSIFEHVFNWGIKHSCLPDGVLKADHNKDVEIMGKRYCDFTLVEEMAYRYACYRLEYYFEVGCRSF